jgi:transposase InsO family protein
MSGPIPARVDGAAKTVLLDVIDRAVSAGWSLARICGVLELDRQRAWRWQRRRLAGCLDDVAPGGNPIHGILAWEEEAVLELFEQWGPVDLSHRKLAHRGSYLERVWVSPSTVDRILARHGLSLAGEPRPPKTVKKPWPEWVQWSPNQLWCWDQSQFERCRAAKYAYAIVDIVSRKWIATLLAAEATSVQVKVLFTQALRAEAILDDLDDRLAHPEFIDVDDETLPVLLAVSDNGTEMTSATTRGFLATMSIAQHHGRPGTPTDQAWIESLWGHVKTEWPHLCRIGEPAVLAAELERVRHHYNHVRLHEGIGYVTPIDEHEGRGDKIRAARRDGLAAADAARRAHHRAVRSAAP